MRPTRTFAAAPAVSAAPIVFAALVVFGARPASARQVNVANAADLSAAIAAAQAGDEIILADGTYTFAGADCAANGTASAPISVHAQHPLFAVLLSTALEGFKVSGANWQFSGLDIRGACANDADCEHAFHVFAAADGFVMRSNRVSDFNAQLKVNAAPARAGGPNVIPNGGLVEGNEIFDTRARNTTTPVTKLDIDTGDGWIVRANYIHDFGKTNTDAVYAAFMKSGSTNGLFERNLVICNQKQMFTNTQVGLSFGGGGTAPEFCAPAFDANTPCAVEHTNGTMRNNIVVNCTDVGIYLNQAQNSHLLHNTLIITAGIDFRFANTSGEARGNLLSNMIHLRDGATDEESNNIINVPMSAFFTWFIDPLNGDLRKMGNQSTFQQLAPPLQSVPDDYCARPRIDPKYDVGALETTLGDCVTVPPPLVASVNPVELPDLSVLPDGGVGVRAAPGCGCEVGAAHSSTGGSMIGVFGIALALSAAGTLRRIRRSPSCRRR